MHSTTTIFPSFMCIYLSRKIFIGLPPEISEELGSPYVMLDKQCVLFGDILSSGQTDGTHYIRQKIILLEPCIYKFSITNLIYNIKY